MSKQLRFGSEINAGIEDNGASARIEKPIFRSLIRAEGHSSECLVVKAGFPHRCAAVLSVWLACAMAATRLCGASPSYPDEIKNPHLVSPQLQFGTFGTDIGELNKPAGLCVSASGEIYIVDTFNHRIQVFAPSGEPLRTWGEAGSAPRQFVAPGAIAVSQDNEVFVADTGNDRIQVFDKAGNPLRQWGSFGDRAGEFKEPSAIAVDDNRIYVVDQGNERLQVSDFNGKPVFALGNYGDQPGEFNHPSDVTIDNQANIYVADSYNDRIQVFDRLGQPLHTWGNSGSHNGLLATPTGVCYREGKLYVADSINHRVQVFDPEGGFLFQWGRHPYPAHHGDGMLHYPFRLAAAPKGERIVVLEPCEYRCQAFDTETVAQAEKVRALAWWQLPEGFHFGARIQSRGPLVAISEPDTQSVLVFDDSEDSPKLVTKLGGHGKEPGQFIYPNGIEIDPDSGEVYVSDSGHDRLQRFALQRDADTGSFLSKTSSFVTGIDFQKLMPADAGLAFGAIPRPGAIKRDSQGNFYMADTKNARIIVFDKDTKFIRSWGGWGDKEGQFKMPSDLAFNQAEDILYVIDPYNFRVQAFNKNGKFLFAWGSPGILPDQFLYPTSLCVGTDGSVFVADAGANRIDKFDPQGRSIRQWGSFGTAPGQFYEAGGLVQDEKGRIVVVDLGNDRVQRFSPEGEFLSMFAVGELPHTAAHLAQAAQSIKARRDQSIRISRSAQLESAPVAGKSVLSNAGAYRLKYLATPEPIPLNQPFDLQFSLKDQNGHTFGPETNVQVDAGMPAHHHGMNQKPMVSINSDGTYTVSGMLFHMPGLWQIYFDVTRNGVTERAQSDVTLD